VLLGIVSNIPSLSQNIKVRYIEEAAGGNATNFTSMHGQEAYPDEAALDLALDFDLVMKVTEELRKEGRLVEA
jgi:hypothetical protein